MTDPFPDGVVPVMLTPFTADNEVDYPALDALVDWYLDAGAAGLFPVSQSSEMFDLTDDERLAVAERVAERADVPVVATGTFGGPIEEQAAFVDRMADTGVDAVVVNTGQLAAEDADEETWEATLEELLGLTDAPLGFYECPQPYHRTLSPAALGRAAETGRFRFHKDTCCDPGTIARKVDAIDGTPLRLYNANAPTLRPSLRDGAAGYSGIAANVYPELLVWLCANHDDPRADDLDAFLTVADHAARNKYPTSAKAALARRGLDVEPVSRVADHDLEPRDERTIDAIATAVGRWRDDLGIADPLGAG